MGYPYGAAHACLGSQTEWVNYTLPASATRPPSIRAAICEPLSDLYGINFDTRANDRGETCISKPDSSVIVETVHTDEAMMIARYGRAMLEATPVQIERRVS